MAYGIGDGRRRVRTGVRAAAAGAAGAAAATPTSRERSVDLLRALAIVAVVLGHWLAAVVESGEGRLAGQSILALWRPGHLLTWAFQVMPVFFLVGGYANAASWTSRREGGVVAWLGGRTRRLLRPTTAFLVLGTALAVLARAAGADVGVVRTAAWVVGIPLWFLALYVALVAVTPIVVGAVGRYGLQVPLALGTAAALVDLLRLGLRVGAVGLLNVGLVWLCVFALGACWRTGRLRPSHGTVLAGGGLATLVLLVALGPYPLSMVSVPGAELHNTSPPSLALLALGLTQAGLVLLLREPLERLARRPRVWVAVVAVNGAVLTVYLWHMASVVVAAALLHATGVLPEPEPVSAAWFALRPAWVAGCGVVLLPVVVVMARLERGTPAAPAPTTRPRLALAGLGLLSCCGGLVVLTVGGLSGDGPGGLPASGLAPYAAGLAALTLATRPRRG